MSRSIVENKLSARRWDLSPAYDLTFSPDPFDEHSTGFQG